MPRSRQQKQAAWERQRREYVQRAEAVKRAADLVKEFAPADDDITEDIAEESDGVGEIDNG